MNKLEQIMKQLMFIALEFKQNENLTLQGESNFYRLMGELMQLTGFNYQQAEDMLICWIENPEKIEVLKDVV